VQPLGIGRIKTRQHPELFRVLSRCSRLTCFRRHGWSDVRVSYRYDDVPLFAAGVDIAVRFHYLL
jgi:hypothetical protein